MKKTELNRNAGADKENQNEIDLTADEEPFDISKEYFYFDHYCNGVKSSRGLRQTGDYLTTRMAAIATLRRSREDALQDGVTELVAQLESIYGTLDELDLWDVIDDLTAPRG